MRARAPKMVPSADEFLDPAGLERAALGCEEQDYLVLRGRRAECGCAFGPGWSGVLTRKRLNQGIIPVQFIVSMGAISFFAQLRHLIAVFRNISFSWIARMTAVPISESPVLSRASQRFRSSARSWLPPTRLSFGNDVGRAFAGGARPLVEEPFAAAHQPRINRAPAAHLLRAETCPGGDPCFCKIK